VNVLVTGGARFIGHHLVRALVARGDDVVVFDDFSTGRRDRVSDIGASRIVEGDLREGPSLVTALKVARSSSTRRRSPRSRDR
jgi:UDP-glucose 4-epimerase